MSARKIRRQLQRKAARAEKALAHSHSCDLGCLKAGMRFRLAPYGQLLFEGTIFEAPDEIRPLLLRDHHAMLRQHWAAFTPEERFFWLHDPSGDYCHVCNHDTDMLCDQDL